jgi:hypothetical protein
MKKPKNEIWETVREAIKYFWLDLKGKLLLRLLFFRGDPDMPKGKPEHEGDDYGF